MTTVEPIETSIGKSVRPSDMIKQHDRVTWSSSMIEQNDQATWSVLLELSVDPQEQQLKRPGVAGSFFRSGRNSSSDQERPGTLQESAVAPEAAVAASRSVEVQRLEAMQDRWRGQ